MKWTLLMCLVLAAAVTARKTPPKITLPQGNMWPHPVEYVRQSNSRNFTCEASGEPKPKYMWQVNGTKLVNSDKRRVWYDETTGILTTGSLFGAIDTGNYQCIAMNEMGKAMTPFLNIQATRAEPFPGQEATAQDVTAYVSTYLEIECKDVPISVPQWKFSWERGKMVNNKLESSPVDLGERMVIDPKGNLHFLWVENSDNNYIYACATKNEVLLVEVRNTQTIRLNVKTASLKDRAPELKYVKDVEVRAGENAELMCIFTYYSSIGERLKVNWFLRGEPVGEGQSLLISGVQLPSDTQNQEGEYLCEASLGSYPKVRGTVNLRVIAPPEFISGQAPQTKSVPVEKDAVFTCGTTSHNSYSMAPTWLVNTEPLIGCPPYFFECKAKKSNDYSQCIEERYMCDGAPDCTDSSDEQGCPPSCPESLKRCGDQCIPSENDCSVLQCDYPGFMCKDKKACLSRSKKCDGTFDCADQSDELFCPNKAVITRGRFRLSSDRTQLTLPHVSLTDTMCFQCMVTNDYGTAIGDGCLTVIDKIMLLKEPNKTYEIEPGYNLFLEVDATTDILWQNQMKFRWFWYSEVEDEQTKHKVLVQEKLPPVGELGQYFVLSQNGKQMTISYPEVPMSDEKAYHLYYQMKDRKYTIVIEHQYDRVEFNFSTSGVDIVKPTPAPAVEMAGTNLWFIALILGIILLFVVIILIVCYMHRNRGGTYPLDKKEHQAGHDPAQELKDSGFHDVGRVDDDEFDKPKEDEASLTESVKPYESDDDPTEEYGGDFDVSKFNEDGSFIGLYGDKKSKFGTEAKEATV